MANDPSDHPHRGREAWTRPSPKPWHRGTRRPLLLGCKHHCKNKNKEQMKNRCDECRVKRYDVRSHFGCLPVNNTHNSSARRGFWSNRHGVREVSYVISMSFPSLLSTNIYVKPTNLQDTISVQQQIVGPQVTMGDSQAVKVTQRLDNLNAQYRPINLSQKTLKIKELRHSHRRQTSQ